MKSKHKHLEGRQGFTLIEIIVVLVIVGILAAISLPMYFNWVIGSKTAEALQNLSSFKDTIEGCLDSHVGNEHNCDSLGTPFPASFNWTYKWGDLLGIGPLDTPGGGGSLSACATSIIATPTFNITFNFPLEDTAYASGVGPANNTVIMSRAANGIWTCSGTGAFITVC